MNEAPASNGRLFAHERPWGLKAFFIGLGVAGVLFVLSSVVLAVVIALLDSEPLLDDEGDIFEIAGRIVEYTDERLRAAATDMPLPDPPALKADIVSIRAAFLVTAGYQLAIIAMVPLVTRRSPAQLVRDLGMNRFDGATLWLPFVMVVVTYLGVGIYGALAEAFGPDELVPESTVPSTVTRDTAALVFAGVAAVIIAPFSEELLFRGLFLGGLLRWGFWPAAVISALLFSAIHLDPGSLIPFFGIGLVLAWLAWRRGSLLDAISFHLMFNLTSFIILLLVET